MKAHRLALILALALPALTQSGVTRWGSYKSFAYGPDRVDRGLLNLHLEFPLFNRATVGNAEVNLRLTYDSNLNLGFVRGGWNLIQPQGELPAEFIDNGPCGWYDPVTGIDDDTGNPDDESSEMMEVQYSLIEPDGTWIPGGGQQWLQKNFNSQHPIGWVTDCPTFDNPSEQLIPDGKGYTVLFDLSYDASAYDTAGNEIAATTVNTANETATESNALVDPHGNEVSYSVSGGVTTYADPLGNAVTVTPSSTQVLYTYKGPNGGSTTITEDLETPSLSVNFGCSGEQNENVSPTLVRDLIYPDGTEYQFGYDPNGILDKVMLPSGATINYSMTDGCTSDGGNSALSRVDSVDGGNGWNWSRTVNSGAATTTEIAPDAGKGVYNFSTPLWPGVGGVLSSATISDSSGNELTALSISTTTTNEGAGGDAVTQQTTSNELYSASSPLYAVGVLSYTALGQTVTENDYDWSSSPSGSGATLLRQTSTTYTYQGHASVPSNITVSDNKGTDSNTVISYDSAGDPLTIEEYTNGSTYLTKSFAYNPNGTVASATDTNGAVTDYTYGDCGGVFPTEIQNQSITAIEATEVWNCTGGVMTSSTDANSQITSIGYSDPANIWRPTSITAPDGSVTDITYTAATSSQAAAVERAMLFNSNTSTDDVLTTSDALGRPILVQRRQAPGATNFDSVETGYDAMDRITAVTLPYTGTWGETAPGGTAATQTTYDALSRPLTVTSGGGTLAYTYTMNDVETTLGPAPSGENDKVKQEQFDGLGRLASVCEVTAGTRVWPGGSCAQTNALTGYYTVYTRNGAGQITKAVQNAQSSSTEPRTFAFDELGRMTSESNPESGTTNYTFDTDSTCGTSDGDLVKRIDANGTVTCYTHDALHRVTEISYTPGSGVASTPNKYFVYDSATVDSVSMANVVGKLAEAYTGSRSTDLGFSYPNPSSNEEDVYQSSPSSGGWYITTVQHYANGVPSTLTLPSGVSAIGYSVDAEGRLAGASAGSTTLASTSYGAAYAPDSPTQVAFGSSGAGGTDSYSYDSGTGRMTQYEFTLGSQSDTGVLSWNPNGSLSQLAITDNITGTGDTQTCGYSHDDLGRLASVSCGSLWGQTFSYDPFGNLAKSASAGQSFSADFNLANQIAGGTSYAASYDSDGDLLLDPVFGSANTFDAEGHAVTFEGVNTVTYDALGRAVEFSNGSSTQEYVYAPDGSKLAVMNGASLDYALVPLPGGGDAEYTASGLIAYHHADNLGSVRLASTPSGGLYDSSAYGPYGELYGNTGSDPRFTGQTAAIATGNYDMLAREYSTIQSRWWSPDPAGTAAADPNFPQSWNRYAYVLNTPLSAVDPTGEIICFADGKYNWLDTDAACQSAGGQVLVEDQFVNVTASGGGAPLISWGGNTLSSPFQPVNVDDSDGGGGGSGGGGNTPQTSSPQNAETPLQCIARNSDALNPANLLGLGNSELAKGLLGGPISAGTAMAAGSFNLSGGIPLGVLTADVGVQNAKIEGNTTLTFYPYITTLTDAPLITTWTIPTKEIAGGLAATFEKIDPWAWAYDFTAASLATVGCGAFE